MDVFKDKCLELIKTYETAQTSKVINREKYDRLVKAILSPRTGVETAHILSAPGRNGSWS